MGKPIDEIPGDWQNVGRWWGVIGRENLPKSQVEEFAEDAPTGIQFGRTIRRYLAAKHRDRCKRQGVKPFKRRAYHMRTIYTQDFLLWSRVLTCASGGAEHYDYERKFENVQFLDWCQRDAKGETPF